MPLMPHHTPPTPSELLVSRTLDSDLPGPWSCTLAIGQPKRQPDHLLPVLPVDDYPDSTVFVASELVLPTQMPPTPQTPPPRATTWDSATALPCVPHCYFTYRPALSALDETPISPGSPSESYLSTPSSHTIISTPNLYPLPRQHHIVSPSIDHPLLAERSLSSYCSTPVTATRSARDSESSSTSASRFFQLQTAAAHKTRPEYAYTRAHLSEPARMPAARSNSASSDSSTSSYSSRASTDAPNRSYATVEVMRCSRCAKRVETVSRSTDGIRRVSADDISANGMVRFGHNLYYCERCAKMVGYT